MHSVSDQRDICPLPLYLPRIILCIWYSCLINEIIIIVVVITPNGFKKVLHDQDIEDPVQKHKRDCFVALGLACEGQSMHND